MKRERLLFILGLLDDTLIEEAEADTLYRKARPGWKRWSALAAACAVLFVGMAYLLPRLGGSAAPQSNEGGAVGGAGASSFMHYAGPVLPLTALEDTAGITAQRTTALDFSGLNEEEYPIRRDLQVTDCYVLSNHTTQDKTLTLAYPFVSSVNNTEAYMPALNVAGEAVEAIHRIGDYAGAFTDAGGEEESLNLLQLSTWEDYKALLSSGAYLQGALEERSLPNDMATVYTFSDSIYPEEYDAATLQMAFRLPEGSTVLSYGMNGLSVDTDTREFAFSYFVAHAEAPRVIVLGEAPLSYELNGYENGGCEQELAGVAATVTLERMPLSEAIEDCMSDFIRQFTADAPQARVAPAIATEAVASMLQYTTLGNTPKDRYDWLMLEDIISEAFSVNRVQYLLTQVEIPAMGTLEVGYQMQKGPSFDFAGAGKKENQNVMGYDLTTTLASTLSFTQQRATLSLPETYRIVRDNFGFMEVDGKLEAVLNLEQEHYYIEIVRSKE